MLWRLLAGAGILALAAFLLVQYGDARERAGRAAERADRAIVDVADAKAAGDARAMQERAVASAASAYADRMAALKPVILTSHDTVTEYAQTPAGAAQCLDADRVRGIDALDAALFSDAAPAAASGRAGAVPTDVGSAPPGR